MNELSSKVKKGLSWTFLNQIVTQVMFVVFGIFLARILSPDDFGTIGLITVFTNYALTFIDLGFSSAIVQRKSVDAEDLSTIFWFNIALGLFLFLAVFFSASLFATFYQKPELKLLTQVLSFSFIINSLALVQNSLLDKALNFKRKVIINWIATFLGYAVGIYLGIRGEGVWALVAQIMITMILNTVLTWLSSNWSPSFYFSGSKLKEMAGFGLNVFGSNALNYWSRNADNFLIGKFVGSEALGLYSRAYSLMLLPMRNISSIIYKVMFPAFSVIQDDIPRIRAIYLRTIRYVAFITFPAMTALTIVAPEFVLVCFGPKWVEMIPLLRWLSMLGTFQSIISLNGVIYYPLGKANIAFKISVITAVILLVCFVAGVFLNGALGVAIAYFIASTVLSIPIYKLAINEISLTLRAVLQTLKGTIGATAGMAAALVLLPGLISITNMPALLAIDFLVGSLVYLSLLWLFEPEFKRLVRERKI